MRPDSTHQEKAVVVARENLQRGGELLRQIGLIGKFADRALLEKFAVERPVDVAIVEEPEQLGRVRLRAGRGKPLSRVDEGVAGLLELLEIVILIRALAARVAFGQKIGRAAAHQHLGPSLVQHAHDVVVVGPPARVRHHAGRRRILDLGVGDDADGHAALALDQRRDRLDRWDASSVLLLLAQ